MMEMILSKDCQVVDDWPCCVLEDKGRCVEKLKGMVTMKCIRD